MPGMQRDSCTKTQHTQKAAASSRASQPSLWSTHTVVSSSTLVLADQEGSVPSSLFLCHWSGLDFPLSVLG